MSGSCLVTGASGFIGGHVVERLARDGYRVRCLVRATSELALLRSLGVEIVVGDLGDAASLTRAAAGCRYVLHCGALVSDWATTGEIERVNVQGTRNVLAAAALAGAERVVHLSSTDVYGYRGGPPIDETYVPRGFSNWYAETKREAEAEVRRAMQAGGPATVILRPATVYGPRSVDVIGDIARAIRRRQMLLIDRGRAVAGLLYVENLVDAVLLALTHEAAPGEAFNVTDGLAVSWRQFTTDLAAGLGAPPPRLSLPYPVAHALGGGLEHGYRALRRTTGLRTPPLLSRQAVHVLGADQSFATGKLRRRLGWAPRVGYAAGLQATLDWLRATAD